MLSFQLQKSPTPDFEEKRGNSPDISKGISRSGMCKFESSQVSQAVRRLEISPSEMPKGPPMAGFCKLAVGLQTPNVAPSREKSPIVSGGCLKYSRFWETAARDRVRSALLGRAPVQLAKFSGKLV
jgi:hypothetical protein